MASTFARLVLAATVSGILAGTPVTAGAQQKSAKNTNIESKSVALNSSFAGDVIFVRGGFDIFSSGLDQMAAKLRKRGVKSRVVSHTRTAVTVAEIVKRQKRFGRKPVVLIGHSWGANEVIRIAQSLLKKGIRVNYMVTFAATNPPPIPRNVLKVTNYYFKKDGWGKPVRRGKGTRGSLKNIDLSKTPGVNHFNIDEFPKLQRQVIRNVLRYVRPRKRA